MSGVKCPNPDCAWDGNAPEWEFCGHCGTELVTPLPKDANKNEIDVAKITAKPVDIKAGKSSPAPAVPVTGVKLVVTRNGRIGHEFAISGESVSIGRWDPESGAYPEIDLTEDDPDCYISRQHARIFLKDGKYFIEDLGSVNRVAVNRSKLDPHVPHELKNDDEIIIGKTFLRFVI